MPGIGSLPGETWRDYGAMSVAMLSLPTLLLCGGGILLALWRRDARDIPCLASLACLGGSTLFLLKHNEARYLLPAVPFILYFALRSIEAALGVLRAHWSRLGWPSRALALSIAAALLAGALRVGVHQALLDEDPVYRADAERRAAERLLAARRGDGRLFWYGNWHTCARAGRGWSRTTSSSESSISRPSLRAISWIAASTRCPARRRRPDELALVLKDGDAVLRTGGRAFDARHLPPADLPPMEVWSAQRLRFRAAARRSSCPTRTPASIRVRWRPRAQGAPLGERPSRAPGRFCWSPRRTPSGERGYGRAAPRGRRDVRRRTRAGPGHRAVPDRADRID